MTATADDVPCSEFEGHRRAFLRLMGGGAAASGMAVLLAACGSSPQTSSTPSVTDPGSRGSAKDPSGTRTDRDIEILNYALTLEHVEAALYAEMVDGKVVKRRKALELVKRFGDTEQTHVEAITAAVKRLGGQPARRPKTAFENVFQGGELMTLMVTATIENVGASAYLGQAPRIVRKDVLAAALSIHTVEARHAAALNDLVGRPPRGGSNLDGTIPDGAFAKPMSMEQVLQVAKPFLTN